MAKKLIIATVVIVVSLIADVCSVSPETVELVTEDEKKLIRKLNDPMADVNEGSINNLNVGKLLEMEVEEENEDGESEPPSVVQQDDMKLEDDFYNKLSDYDRASLSAFREIGPGEVAFVVVAAVAAVLVVSTGAAAAAGYKAPMFKFAFVNALPSDTIRSVKDKIRFDGSELLDLTLKLYRLDGTLLEDKFTVAHYKIKDREVLLLRK